ncbi:periplasmic binding protein-like I [Phlyctochytrium arcticum]|nr:periplasmic binding protein-like I [Phlyctochytrium arcticum]
MAVSHHIHSRLTLATCVLLLISSCLAAVEVKIGLVMPFSLTSRSKEVSGIIPAVRLAIADIISSNFLPGANFTLDIQDSWLPRFSGNPLADTSAQALTATSHMIDGGVVAVIGDLTSPTTEYEGILTSFNQIPQFGPSTSSPTLSNRDIYGYVYRLTHDQERPALLLVDYIISMGWKNVAVLKTTDKFGVAVAAKVVDRLTSHGVQVLLDQGFYQGGSSDKKSLKTALDNLKQVDGRITIICADPVNTADIYYAAYDVGMVGKEYVWLGATGIGNEGDELIEAFGADAIGKTQGFISAYPWTDTEADSAVAFNETWTDLAKTDNITYPLSGKNPFYTTKAAYDIMWLIAHGFKKIMENNSTYTINDLASRSLSQYMSLDVLADTGYSGALGHISLNEAGALIKYWEIYAANGTDYDDMEGTGLVASFETDGTIIFAARKFLNYDGTETVPADHLILIRDSVDFKSGVGAAFMTIYAVTLALCMASLIAILALILKGDKKIIKRSPVFCANILVGLMIFLTTVFFNVGEMTPQKCVAERWVQGVGFAVVMGNVGTKAWRIWRIFDNHKIMSMTLANSLLFKISGGIIAFEMIILGIWTAVDFPIIENRVRGGMYTPTCGTAHPVASQALTIVIFAINGLMLLANAVLSYKTRNAPVDFGEAKQMAYAVYNIVIVAVILVPQSYFGPASGAAFTFVLRFILTWIAIVVTFGLLVASNFMVYITKVDESFSITTFKQNDNASGGAHKMEAAAAAIIQGSATGKDISVLAMEKAPSAKYLNGKHTYRNMSNLLSTWRKCQVQISTITPVSLIIGHDMDDAAVPRKFEVLPAARIRDIVTQGEDSPRFIVITQNGRFVFQTSSAATAQLWVAMIKQCALSGVSRAASTARASRVPGIQNTGTLRESMTSSSS